MYSNCPKCGYEFSWLKKWKLSAKKPYACPKCQTGLLKNRRSERYINLSVIVMLIPQIILWLIGLLERHYRFTIPDNIELPIGLLTTVPPIILGVVYLARGLSSAKFETIDPQKTN